MIQGKTVDEIYESMSELITYSGFLKKNTTQKGTFDFETAELSTDNYSHNPESNVKIKVYEPWLIGEKSHDYKKETVSIIFPLKTFTKMFAMAGIDIRKLNSKICVEFKIKNKHTYELVQFGSKQ